MKNLIRVFVYGTLKRGFINNHILLRCPQEKNFTLDNFAMYNYHKAFPMIIEQKGNIVKGETYNVDVITFNMIDKLEGVPYFYNKKKVKVRGGREGWIYYGYKEKVQGRCLIKSGLWEG